MTLKRTSQKNMFNKFKNFLYTLLSDIVHSCNNKLAEDQSDVNHFRQKSLRFIGQLAALLLNFPKIDTYLIRYDFGKIIVVGDAFRANSINKIFDSDHGSAMEKIERSSVMKLPALTKKWLTGETQMVVCALSPLFPLSFSAPYSISSPSLLRQILELPEQIESLLEKPELRRIRRQINRAQRFEFEAQFSQKQQDFDFYYWQMYVPYIQKRFGVTAVIEPFEVQFQEFIRGGLILVTKGGEPISGMLTRVQDNYCYYINVGVSESGLSMLEEGLFSYNLWELIQWGHQQGARWVDFGGSTAFQSDGIFQYKSNWGADIRLSRFAIKDMLFLMGEPSTEFIELINRKGIIHHHQGKFYQAHFLKSPEDTFNPILDKNLKNAKRSNLSGLVIASPFSKKYLS